MQRLPENLRRKLEKRRDQHALRKLVLIEDKVDFVSNDYLGFARNKEIYQSIVDFVDSREIISNGATGSRLLSGNNALIEEAEQYIAEFQKSETALIFNSGYDANIGFFSAVPQRGDLIFYDEYVHASIRDGIRLSLADHLSFRHNNLADLEEKLGRFQRSGKMKPDTNVFVVTESIFSMDGDSPEFQELSQLCRKEACLLVLDEAHAFGLYGEQGRGLANEHGLEAETFARLITFGKALGCHGAAVLGSAQLREFLINFARSFIYTTGLSSHSIAAILVGHQFLVADEGKRERQKLKDCIHYFRKKVKDLNLEEIFIPSTSAIQSCLIPGNTNVRRVSEFLGEKDVDVRPILSPTVAKDRERLRFCLHSFNSETEIENALDLLAKSLIE